MDSPLSWWGSAREMGEVREQSETVRFGIRVQRRLDISKTLV